MREQLVRRNYAASTIRTYLRIVEEFRTFNGKRLDHAKAEDLRSYHAHLLGERKLAPLTVVQRVAAVPSTDSSQKARARLIPTAARLEAMCFTRTARALVAEIGREIIRKDMISLQHELAPDQRATG